MTQPITLTRIKAAAAALREKTARAALLPAVLLAASPAFAALPEFDMPTETMEGLTSDGWLGGFGGLAKLALTIAGLVGVGWLMYVVITGAIGKWRSYSLGRIEQSDLIEYMVMGIVVAAFAVVVGGYLMTTIA